jgi:hypothetical protein
MPATERRAATGKGPLDHAERPAARRVPTPFRHQEHPPKRIKAVPLRYTPAAKFCAVRHPCHGRSQQA